MVGGVTEHSSRHCDEEDSSGYWRGFVDEHILSIICLYGRSSCPGPSGLVTLKTLLEQSSPELEYDPIILEAEDDIGGTFKYAGQSSHIPSIRILTCPLEGIEATRTRI